MLRLSLFGDFLEIVIADGALPACGRRRCVFSGDRYPGQRLATLRPSPDGNGK
jgi:hypothetical protein